MRYFLSLLIVTALMAVSYNAEAFRFSPFRAKLDPSGPGSSKLFDVENNSDEPASVEIRVTTRNVDVDGMEKNKDDEKNFSIYPAQMILQPREKKSVRIGWIGDASLKTEKAFRVIAEQLPVNLDKKKQGKNSVKILVTYHTALFVTPPEVSHEVVLDFLGATKSADGKKMGEIVLHNRGGQHALLRNLKLDLKDTKGNTVSLSGEQLKRITGEGILAEKRRRFLLPWPKELSGDLKSMDFTFDKQAF